MRHRDVFLSLARATAPATWAARAAELATLEADILANRAIVARIH